MSQRQESHVSEWASLLGEQVTEEQPELGRQERRTEDASRRQNQ